MVQFILLEAWHVEFHLRTRLRDRRDFPHCVCFVVDPWLRFFVKVPMSHAAPLSTLFTLPHVFSFL